MKLIKLRATILALSVICFGGVSAQQICLKENFDIESSIVFSSTPLETQWRSFGVNLSPNINNPSLENEPVFGLSNIFDQSDTSPVFIWKANGAADSGEYWNPRQRINSLSLGGAAVIDGDSYDFVGAHEAWLISPKIDIPAAGPENDVFLSFRQYYRAFDSNGSSGATVQICNSGDCDFNDQQWTTVYGNGNVGNGVETKNGQLVSINITDYLYSDAPLWANSFRIRFTFPLNNYFWIIDDVSICENNPRPPTCPTALGDSIYTNHPYDYVDCRSPFVPDEIVVEFKSTTTAARRQEIRDSLGVDMVDSCACNKNLELWYFNKVPRHNSNALSTVGDTIIDIQDAVKAAKSKSGSLEGGSFNFYHFTDYLRKKRYYQAYDASIPLVNPPTGVSANDSGQVVLAILDTGIDYRRPEIAARLWRNPDSIEFYPGDIIGHNYIERNNNPLDSNGHATRISEMINGQLPFQIGAYKILPLKTHDKQGVGTLFNNACAMYYALKAKADIIVGAFGWQADTNQIFSRAIDSTRIKNDAICVFAAGNYPEKLDTFPFFPAGFNKENQVNVASVNKLNQLSYFSAFSPNYVPIAAVGEDWKFEGFPDTARFSGTSYSAPQVASALAALKWLTRRPAAEVIDMLLGCAYKFPALSEKIDSGRVLNTGVPCFYPEMLEGRLVYALTSANVLISFDSDKPELIRSAAPIRGLLSKSPIVGIDIRPSNGLIYAVAYEKTNGQARLYQLDISTGFTTIVGVNPIQLRPNMGQVSMDFDPVFDHLRITGSDNSNFRVNPESGELIAMDNSLTYSANDIHANLEPSIGAIAFSNNIEGAANAPIFAYDDSLNTIVSMNPGQPGVIKTVGISGISINPEDPSVDLDIYTDMDNGSNFGYLCANTRNSHHDDFYTIDLQTGEATFVGKIGAGIPVLDIAVYVKEPEEACETKIVDCIKYEVLGIGIDAQQNRRFKIKVTNNCSEPMLYTAFGLPKGVVAEMPEHNSIYNSIYGHAYEARNPSFSPFYSVRFKDLAEGIYNGQKDIFQFSLPLFVQTDFLLVKTVLNKQTGFETYLSLFGCDSEGLREADDRNVIVEQSASGNMLVYPNPGGGLIHVDLTAYEDESQALITLKNMLGQSILSLEGETGMVNPMVIPDKIPNGIYLVTVQSQNGHTESVPVVIER